MGKQFPCLKLHVVKRFMWEPSVARAASTPGVEAADPGFEHRSTLDFHGYCSMCACGVRVCCGVSAIVWCVPRLLGQPRLR